MLFARLLFRTDCCCLQYLVFDLKSNTNAFEYLLPGGSESDQIAKAKKSNKIKMSLHLLMLTGDSGIEEGLSAMLRSIPTSLLLRFLCREHRLQVELRSSLIVYLQVV